MTKKTKLPARELAKLKKLFGPAPVLSTERIRDYNAISARFTECIDPCDPIEVMFVDDLTRATWEIIRLSRHKTLMIERGRSQRQKMEEKRLLAEGRRKRARAERAADEEAKKAEEEAKMAKAPAPVGEATEAEPTNQAEPANQAEATLEAEPTDQAGAPTTLFERKLELEAVIDDTVDDVDDILPSPADEFDHAEVLQSHVKYYEQLDHLLGVAIYRRNDVLKQIDFYRQGLGHRLRGVSDEIIDAEFKEAQQEVPSIVGPGDGGQ